MPTLRARVAAIAVAAAALILAAPASALAHDELITSTPAAEQSLDTAPDTVTLGYSAELLEIGAAVTVTSDDGTDWAASEPVIAGTSVTVPLREGMPDGAYTVRWRVVSSDGHPISGLIPFTVGGAAAAPTPSPAETATIVDDEAQDGEPLLHPALRTTVIAVGGAAAALALFAVARILIRRGRAAAGATSERSSR